MRGRVSARRPARTRCPRRRITAFKMPTGLSGSSQPIREHPPHSHNCHLFGVRTDRHPDRRSRILTVAPSERARWCPDHIGPARGWLDLPIELGHSRQHAGPCPEVCTKTAHTVGGDHGRCPRRIAGGIEEIVPGSDHGRNLCLPRSVDSNTHAGQLHRSGPRHVVRIHSAGSRGIGGFDPHGSGSGYAPSIRAWMQPTDM
jgi:hypothetical protein